MSKIWTPTVLLQMKCVWNKFYESTTVISERLGNYLSTPGDEHLSAALLFDIMPVPNILAVESCCREIELRHRARCVSWLGHISSDPAHDRTTLLFPAFLHSQISVEQKILTEFGGA